MSKKSRRRNRKILGALAAGLGAAAMMRGRRNKAIDEGIAIAEDDKGSDMLDAPYITRTTAPNFDPNFLLPGAKDGGRIGARKGGHVTGAAKRGFGRALMKGKH